MLAGVNWQKLLELPQIAIVGGLFVGLVIPVVGIITHYLHQTRKVESDNLLKRNLVEKGLSVDEIERIMDAGKDEPETEA